MILIVDDNADLVELLRRAITAEGYRVETSADGVEAYKHLKDPECKCMLLDVNMPKISGVELLLLMQADGILVPTIVMAGFADFDEKEMAQFSNVVKLFHKPFEIPEMLAALKQYALV